MSSVVRNLIIPSVSSAVRLRAKPTPTHDSRAIKLLGNRVQPDSENTLADVEILETLG